MEKDSIRVGILGISSLGQKFLLSLFEDERYEIVAIAGKNQETAERLSAKYKCKLFNDYRQLILASNLDLLIDAEPSHIGIELSILALKNKINILKLSHAGPRFEDYAEIIRAASKNQVSYLISNLLAYSPGFTALREYIQNEDNQTNDIYLLSIYGAYPTVLDTPENRWLTDPELAYGGVLQHNSYEIINEVIRNIATPEQVYGLITNLAPDKKQRMSLTEDAAVLSLKFPDRLIGTLEASRVASPAMEYLKLYRPGQCLTSTRSSFVITDNQDNIIHETTGPLDDNALITAELDDIKAFLSGDAQSTLIEEGLTLQSLALIEAAYLSYRTLMPETPEKISRIASLEANPFA